MNKITVLRDPSYAPCGFLVCCVDNNGEYDAYSDNPQDVALFQTDWEWPSLASNFGYVPCKCGHTDGTVDCEHKTASQMISDAFDWLCDHEGEIVDDPGYFDFI